MQAECPYPNPFEILRYFLRCFDFKQSNKRLDDLARTSIHDPKELDFQVRESFSNVAEKYIGKRSADLISAYLTKFLNSYLVNIVGKVSVDGLNRSAAIDLLVKKPFKEDLVDILLVIQKEVRGPHPSLWLASQGRSVGEIIDWVEKNESGWNAHIAALEKEKRDIISGWKKGNHLPSAQSVLLFSRLNTASNDRVPHIDWDRVNTLILVSRAIDFIKNESAGRVLLDEARIALWGGERNGEILGDVRLIQNKVLSSLGDKKYLFAKLQSGLLLRNEKGGKEDLREAIDQARFIISSTDNLRTTEYWIDWCDARWHIFSGCLEKGNELYKSAFNKALYVSGDNLPKIVEEALVVAASQERPDRVFLKSLKWALLMFGYDIESVSRSTPSQKTSETIEEWEIELWKSSFSYVFPGHLSFHGVDYEDANNIGPMIFSEDSEKKPDYRYPDRKIKIEGARKRIMPQLVWFSNIEKFDVCRELIDKGADVDVCSEVGDTPILMALEALNVTEVPYRSLNSDLFDFISDNYAALKTINVRTQKLRLLPIISAVQSGRIEVVEKVLSMGADPNGRGLTDEQSALNVCLKLIGILKNPEEFVELQRSMPITPEALDSIRRYSGGLSGFMLYHQEKYLEKAMNDPRLSQFQDVFSKLRIERIMEKMSLNEMREIARKLIEFGADVNAAHSSPVKGYTPLMLAAEIDERGLFEAMLVAGGDVGCVYTDPKTGKGVSITEIAKFFRSTGVLQVLDDIAPYIKSH